MVKGIEVFQEYFQEFTNQYVLIGGAACSVAFSNQNIDFRATRDLDIVLVVEAQTKEFGQQFWKFVRDGKYQNRAKSNGNPQFYRFDKPEDERFPKMIELFSRTKYLLNEDTGLTPIHIDDAVSSLSAILLNESYYNALLQGREVIDGISVLKPEWLIPFKAKAWLDLQKDQRVDTANVKKHKNDIVRIVTNMPLTKCNLPSELHADMQKFIEMFSITEEELKSLRIKNIHPTEIISALSELYL